MNTGLSDVTGAMRQGIARVLPRDAPLIWSRSHPLLALMLKNPGSFRRETRISGMKIKVWNWRWACSDGRSWAHTRTWRNYRRDVRYQAKVKRAQEME